MLVPQASEDHVRFTVCAPVLGTLTDVNSDSSKDPLTLKSIHAYKVAVLPVVFVTGIFVKE